MARTSPEASLARLALDQANQRIEVRCEQVLAAEVTDDALLVLAVVAVGLDQTDVLMLDALAACGLDRA